MASPDTLAPPRRRLLWWSLAALTIVLGYVELAIGSDTLAPILLILGYCALVPIAILQ
jgi:hypothetical protein